MYCKAFVDDVFYSAVEHIKPKSLFPNLILEWANLGLSCQRCNSNKGSYYTEEIKLQILNPYVDFIEDHVQFVGPLVVARDGSQRGVNTIRKLKIDKREELVLSKMKRIEDLESSIRLWHEESRPSYKDLLAEDVQ